MSRVYFHWRRLVTKYSRPITAYVQEKGEYHDGRYHTGREYSETYTGAILSKNRSAVNGDGGNYGKEDKILYMLSPIPHPLETVQIEFGGVRYTPLMDRDHEDAFFTGVYVYKLSQVDKFREEAHRGT